MFHFHKYQGTGNDFIIVDNRENIFTDDSISFVAHLCDRRFGIGADGLILLKNAEGYDFEMDYFNSDGRRSSMCGNGGRCITMFAHKLGIIKDKAKFLAADGPHEAEITSAGVNLKMTLPSGFVKYDDRDFWINTGSPHYIRFVHTDINHEDVVKDAREIRYSPEWKEEGTNVNFVQGISADSFLIRSYERGVEGETLSCGTGVTAAAEVWSRIHGYSVKTLYAKTMGGILNVHVSENAESWLEGHAEFVFEGKWN